MNSILVLLFVLGTSQCSTLKRDATNNTSIDTPHLGQNEDIIINGKNASVPPFTDVTEVSPPPEPHSTTTNYTTTTTNGTTTSPPTTPTTPNTTTPTTTTTKTTITTTTLKPTTSSEKPTTTVKPTPAPPAPTHGPSTTSKPIEPTTPVPDHHRRFDGPSFIGGIVLASGLVAIGFVAFKFYKARTELNYHTL